MHEFKTKSPIGTLTWFWSDRFWYVGVERNGKQVRQPGRHRAACGSGKTRDEAYRELQSELLGH